MKIKEGGSIGEFPHGSSRKESVCNAGDPGGMYSFPGLGRSPGGGHGNPLQYFCLKNTMNRGVWWATVHRVAQGRKDSDKTEAT